MEKRTKKQLMFDIDTKVAEAILGDGYRQIYGNIKKHLQKNGFLHIEGSGYTSLETMSKIQVAQIISDLIDEYPYLTKCVRDIRQANVSDEQSLNNLFEYDGTTGKYTTMESHKKADKKQKDQIQDKSNKGDDVKLTSLKERIEQKKKIVGQQKYPPNPRGVREEPERYR